MSVREPSRRRRWIKRTVWLLLLVVAVAVGAWGYRVARSFAGKGSFAEVWQGITNPRGLFPGRDRVTILVIGKDWNHNAKGIRYSSEARADTIMLISADLKTPKLSVMSIPRDTRIVDERGLPHKINWVFQERGVEGLRAKLLVDFGISTDYHVLLRDDAVEKLVDAVGGVTVDAIDDMFYEDYWGGLKIDLAKGEHRLDGKQAVGFVRFRKWGTHRYDDQGRMTPVRKRTSKEEGDIRRAERQQQVVRALLAEAMRPGNLLHADRIVETGFEQIETNLSRPQVLALATLFKGVGSASVSSAVLPGTDSTEGGVYYYLPDPQRAMLTVDWILNGNELSGRRLTRAIIYNGTKVTGVARSAAALIGAIGFTATVGGTASEKIERTEILYRRTSSEGFAREIARALGAQVVQKDDKADARAIWLPEVKVTIGSDLADKLARQGQSPPAPGAGSLPQ